MLLGFGGVLGLGSGCGTNRTTKSRTQRPTPDGIETPGPTVDGIVTPGPTPDTMLFRVMYGVLPVPYKIEQVPERRPENTETTVQ